MRNKDQKLEIGDVCLASATYYGREIRCAIYLGETKSGMQRVFCNYTHGMYVGTASYALLKVPIEVMETIYAFHGDQEFNVHTLIEECNNRKLVEKWKKIALKSSKAT